jgi:hypothetical protein
VIDSSVVPDTKTKYAVYDKLQDKKLILDFIFLFAHNAIRHYKCIKACKKIEFRISQKDQYLVFRSNSGDVQLDESEVRKIARALSIPPNVRKYFVDQKKGVDQKKDIDQKKDPDDTDGVTLWSVARYFWRLNMPDSKTDPKLILPIGDDSMFIGYNYFKICIENPSEGKYNFVIMMKCLE